MAPGFRRICLPYNQYVIKSASSKTSWYLPLRKESHLRSRKKHVCLCPKKTTKKSKVVSALSGVTVSRSEGSRFCKVSQWQHLQLLEGNKRGNIGTWSKSTNIAKFSIQHDFFVNNLSVYHWVCISYTRNINVCKYQISLSWWTRFQKRLKLTEHFTFRNWWTTPPVVFHGLFTGGIFAFSSCLGLRRPKMMVTLQVPLGGCVVLHLDDFYQNGRSILEDGIWNNWKLYLWNYGFSFNKNKDLLKKCVCVCQMGKEDRKQISIF